jgi:hypothetical protein
MKRLMRMILSAEWKAGYIDPAQSTRFFVMMHKTLVSGLRRNQYGGIQELYIAVCHSWFFLS